MRRVALLLATALCLFAAPSTAARSLTHLRYESEGTVGQHSFAMLTPEEEVAKHKLDEANSAVSNAEKDASVKQGAAAAADAAYQAAISNRKIAQDEAAAAQQRLVEAQAIEDSAKAAAENAQHEHSAAQKHLSQTLGAVESAAAELKQQAEIAAMREVNQRAAAERDQHRQARASLVHKCTDHVEANDASCAELVDIATQLNNLHWQKCTQEQNWNIKMSAKGGVGCDATTISELKEELRKLTTQSSRQGKVTHCALIPGLKQANKPSISIRQGC